MAEPLDVVKGKIVGIADDGEITIKARCDIGRLIQRDYKECVVQLTDSRPLSAQQRKACYAMLREISDYTGMGVEASKEWLKLKFIANDLDGMMDWFSLSDAPMSLVAGFQRFLVRFIVDYDIPCKVSLLDYVDDIDDYIYACLKAKHCCICGRDAGLYMHGDKAVPLCGAHSDEAKEKGFDNFREMYHINDGVVLDKHLLKVYMGGNDA